MPNSKWKLPTAADAASGRVVPEFLRARTPAPQWTRLPRRRGFRGQVAGALLTSILALGVLVAQGAAAEDPARPRLQVINGSTQALDVFWLKSDAERVPNGTVAPGENTVITTTIGHRFVLVGRSDRAEMTVTSQVAVQAVRFAPPDKDGVPAFYTRRVSAHGFPIVASARVNPYALKEAAYLVDLMLARRPEVREAMIRSGARLSILAWDEFTTDQPEWVWLGREPEAGFPGIAARDFRDARARGMGGSETDPFCSCAEENLLAYPGDPYAAECILIHEFAHNIHLRGMANVDPTFDRRLRRVYDAAMKAGLWKGKYASVNHHEYFAEGVQSWFDNNRENDHDHNHVNTRVELVEYDPGLAEMCREVFGDTELKYTKPQTRLTGHLEGYDPAKAPTFEWPERLRAARDAIRREARARSAAAGTSGRETSVVLGWTVHVSRELLAKESAATALALKLLEAQLAEVSRVVPATAVAELKKVPLYFSPPYAGFRGTAEYHPDAGWLQEHGRDPAMARGVEFTDTRDFEAETRRMPVFVLHELAHAYHDRVLGNDHPGIKAAYAKARASGRYDRVERQDSEGRKRMDRAYALTNPQEYFAECSEAFFGRNDFFPYTSEELKAHDPEMFALLSTVWNANPAGIGKTR